MILYIVTKERGVYFDVMKNRSVGEETALQLVPSGIAVFKDKDIDDGTEDEFVYACEANPAGNNTSKVTHNISAQPNLNSSGLSSIPLLPCLNASDLYRLIPLELHHLLTLCSPSNSAQQHGMLPPLPTLQGPSHVLPKLRKKKKKKKNLYLT